MADLPGVYGLDPRMLAEVYSMMRWWRNFQRGGRQLPGEGDSGEAQAPAHGVMPFRPDTGLTVPPYGVFKDNGGNTYDYGELPTIVAKQLAADSDRPIYVNGQCGTSSTDTNTGWCIRPGSSPIKVLYDSADGTPAAGETWGPASGTWKIKKDKPGFKIIGAVDATASTVWAQWPGSGIGSDSGVLDADLDTNDPNASAGIDSGRLTVYPVADSDLGYIPSGRTVQIQLYADGKWRVTGGGSYGWFEFTPTASFSTSDAAFSATIDVIHGRLPDAVNDTVTVNNTKSAFSGDTSTLGIAAKYDPIQDAYYAFNLGCPPA